jgi:hypothetical protein
VSSFADLWKQADEDDWEPPAGTYKVIIVDASAFESRDGRQFAKVRLQVTEGAFADKQFEHFMGFNSAVAARISKGELSMYGMDVAGITDWYEVEESIPRLVGTKAEVTVKHKDGYVNTNVLRSFTGESDATKSEDAALFEHTPASGSRNAIRDDDDVPY